jgi:hypothetical protein
MAGKAAKCKCGFVLKIPRAAASTDTSFKFACPSCGKTHQANASMAGSRARCNQCGTIVQVPKPISNTDDHFWDEVAVHQSASQQVLNPTPTPQEAAQSAYASLHSCAITRISSGASPAIVRRELIGKGANPETAERIIRSVAPESYIERGDNRKRGLNHMRIGGCLFLMGILATVLSAFLFGPLVIIFIGLLLWGMFHFLYGLIMWLTGYR